MKDDSCEKRYRKIIEQMRQYTSNIMVNSLNLEYEEKQMKQKEPTISKKWLLENLKGDGDWGERIKYMWGDNHEYKGLCQWTDKMAVDRVMKCLNKEFSDTLVKEAMRFLDRHGVLKYGSSTGKSLPPKKENPPEAYIEGAVWKDKEGKRSLAVKDGYVVFDNEYGNTCSKPITGKHCIAVLAQDYGFTYSHHEMPKHWMEDGCVWIDDEDNEYTIVKDWSAWGMKSSTTIVYWHEDVNEMCRKALQHNVTYLRPAEKHPEAAYLNHAVWGLGRKEAYISVEADGCYMRDLKSGDSYAGQFASRKDLVKEFSQSWEYRPNRKLAIVPENASTTHYIKGNDKLNFRIEAL